MYNTVEFSIQKWILQAAGDGAHASFSASSGTGGRRTGANWSNELDTKAGCIVMAMICNLGWGYSSKGKKLWCLLARPLERLHADGRWLEDMSSPH